MYYINMSFLLNKNANILAFDEVIGKNTSYEGNSATNSIKENIEIIEYLIGNNCTTHVITLDMLEELSTIIKKTKDNIEFNIKNINDYFLTGWKGHAILLFYEKQQNSNNYDVGIINAGQGTEIQGIYGNLCNGIIIFKNISLDKIKDFLTKYKIFINNSINDRNFEEHKRYYSFYFLLIKTFYNLNQIDFNQLIIEQKIEYIQLSSQILGSCAFINHFNYLAYILYKKILLKI